MKECVNDGDCINCEYWMLVCPVVKQGISDMGAAVCVGACDEPTANP